MVWHPVGSYHCPPIHCCLWKWPNRKKNSAHWCCHPIARKSTSQAVLSGMHLTLHATRRTPYGASGLVPAMPAWSVKTRRAPSRHCRDARRAHGHTTTAMLGIGCAPLAPAAVGPKLKKSLRSECVRLEMETRQVNGKTSPLKFLDCRPVCGIKHLDCPQNGTAVRTKWNLKDKQF